MSELIPWVVAVLVGIASSILTWYYLHHQAISQKEELRLKKKEIEELQKQNQNLQRLLEKKQQELALKKVGIGYNIFKDIANFLQSPQNAYDGDADNEDCW